MNIVLRVEVILLPHPRVAFSCALRLACAIVQGS
jgi:hypothetical protein